MSKSRRVVLLGPQRPDFDIGRVLAELGVRGGVAVVTAGWQERESDDAALIAALGAAGLTAVNLKLHARSEEVFREDRELTTAWRARQERLRHLQSFYRVRLDKIEDAARTIAVRLADPELLAAEWRVSTAQFRQLDQDHVVRCREIHATFDERWQVGDRPAVKRQLTEIATLLESAAAVVIAGGHVASLLNRMKLFDLAALLDGKHVCGWSAGAMVLADRIVLFHDFPPYGTDIAQVLDGGLGLAPGLVVLPDPARRVRTDAEDGIARFAHRMAPALCVAMDPGAKVVFEDGRLAQATAARLTTEGAYEREWTLP